jgi:type 1 glutamine amidotransferase
MRSATPTLLAAGLALLSGTPQASAQRDNPGATPLLILSGGQRQHHGYRDQANRLARLLEDSGRFRASITEDAALLTTPALKKYHILFVIADRRDPEHKLTPEQQNALLAFVHAGGGYVSFHAADNAPPDWLPEMKTMLGGIYSHTGLPDGRAIGGNTWTVKIAQHNHPITQGLPDEFPLEDELYINLQMRNDVIPLATIDFQGTTWPVAWTYQYGQGAVFHTTLGHHRWEPGRPDPLENPNLARLVLQGAQWVADQIPPRAQTPSPATPSRRGQ